MVKMISRYTPLAVCSGNITNNIYSVDFGKLAPSADVVEVAGGSAATVFDYEKPIEIDAPYGAALSVVASGASTSDINIKGFVLSVLKFLHQLQLQLQLLVNLF